ncbi:hypothetical protein EJV47_15110 [Hymenobacter gummosus]|uniref:Uncharacterized protein n=1 Tax=Hymenobacter gummosus TaxID=1776032 RepID=A0A3S0H5N9_9BACT|nr:hypothetical protein [Hymenobacter gummosus]RTQ48920.1 hypothetical protein EJV47_15110 [Hymenobacter gummosus]
MKLTSTLLLGLGLLLMAPLAARAQTFEVPTNVEYKTEADYKPLEPQVIAAVNWLETVPGNAEAVKRQQTNQFLLMWIQGAPNVSVGLQQYVTELCKSNPTLLGLFLGGWARYSLQHPEDKTQLAPNLAAVQTMLNAYQKGGWEKDKNLDNLLALQNKGQLEAWVAKQIKRS